MKAVSVKSVLGKAGLVTIMALTFATSVAAQKFDKNGKAILNEKAVKSYLFDLQHENEGVRRAAVYFAGRYQISETVDILIQQLENEKNPSTRVLIAVALFNIGERKGFDAIYRTASLDPDEKVRRMCETIYNEFASGQNGLAVSQVSK